jgi:hypothetical protein
MHFVYYIKFSFAPNLDVTERIKKLLRCWFFVFYSYESGPPWCTIGMNVEGSNKRLTWNMILVQNLKSYQVGIVDYIILTWCTFFVFIQLHFVNLYYCVENPDPK